MAKCRGCGAEIDFIRTPAGKSMPVDPEPVLYWPRTRGSGKVVNLKGAVVSCTFDGPMTEPGEYGYVPHWATCPVADRFKGGSGNGRKERR